MSHALSPLVRAALFVRDLERSTAFYRALGLGGVYYEGELDGASAATVLAVSPETRTRCRILKREGGPNFGMVGLFELTGPAPAALPAAPGGAPRLGEVALVLYANPVEAAIAAARAAGATWSPEPVMFSMPHRSQLETCLRDPDGVLINLVERDPAEAYGSEPVRG